MRSTTLRTWQRHTLWLSLLGHLLFLLGFTVVLVLAPREEPPTSSPQSVPSYLSPSPEAPPAPQPAPEVKSEPAPKPEPKPEPKPVPQQKQVAKNGIEKSAPKTEQVKAAPKSKASAPRDAHKVSFSRDTVPEDITNPRDQEPLHLVGESKIIKPLIKILARALSQHLSYPRVAADFNFWSASCCILKVMSLKHVL